VTVVVKIGGARAVDPEGALADVAAMEADTAVVHGGSTAVDELLERLGIEPEYVETPDGVAGRFTDAETMEAFTMAMAGTVNTELVAGLRGQGVDAVGLSGVDGGLLAGPRKSAVRVIEDGTKKIKRGDHSGRIENVNAGLLETLLTDGYTPVTGPPMLATEESLPVNADADRAAAAVAGALGATLVVLTDVAGVFEDPEDPETLIETVDSPAGLERVEAAAEGFMTKKVMAAVEALEGGASEVVVADANAETPILAALQGGGTHFTPAAIDADAGAGADAEASGAETHVGTEAESEAEAEPEE
jgi:acetylglutamate/LysW-gamma-L-alpha-aminoadipate kinase